MHLNQVDWSLSGYAPCSFSMEACPSPPGTETSPSPATSRRSSPELHWKDQIYLLLLCREDSQSSFRNHFSLMASRYGRTVQSRVQSPSLPADHRPPVAASPSWLLFVIKTCLPPTPTIKEKSQVNTGTWFCYFLAVIPPEVWRVSSTSCVFQSLPKSRNIKFPQRER